MKELFRELLKKDATIVTSEDIYEMFPDLNENAVQAKIKRCLKGGELVRLYKGIYALNKAYSHRALAEEQVARTIDKNSFLSGMGALRFHNLIPEVVNFKTFYGTKSAKIDIPEIHFEIKKIDTELTTFGIEEVSTGEGTVRVAEPVRAILDTFMALKMSPKTREQICAYLRIEEEDAEKLNWNNVSEYARQMKSKLATSVAAAMLNEA